jgi:phosphoribosylanthranilate isomerase
MTWIKMCGMTRRLDVEHAVEAGTDAVGFVAAPGSPRRVPIESVAALCVDIPIDSYLVTVDLGPAEVVAAAEISGVSGVQPHGEHAEASAEAALAAGMKVLFPVRVASSVDLSTVPSGATPLLDTAVAGRHGGTGQSFDWNLANDAGRDIVIAGGLNPTNVAMAVETARPWGVDVASGIESIPGEKDAEAMRRFVEALR